MTNVLELERTYLAKFKPEGLDKCRKIEILDIYIPKSSRHPTLRVRKNGTRYEITKKEPTHEGDSSQQLENTIPLSEEEFAELSLLEGKRIRKTRYLYEYGERTAEIDVFHDGLEGLVLVDVEFPDVKSKDSFAMPAFCLCDVKQQEFIAGGMLSGKKYSDIEGDLKKFGYKRI